MFLPIGDERVQRRLTPYVNYALILTNIAVFVLLQKMGSDLKFTYSFATVPLATTVLPFAVDVLTFE